MKNEIHADVQKLTSQLKPGGRILFANVPADGHFNPLTGLAVHLLQMGYDVRWYSSTYYEDKIKKLHIPYYRFQKALNVSGENIDEVFKERNEIKSQVEKLKYDMINFFILRSTEYYDDIKEINEAWPFDVMVADVAFSAIPLVRETLGKPVISIGVFPLTETSKDLPPSGLGMTPSYTFFGKLKQRFLRYYADQVLFKQPNKVMKDLLDDYGIDTGNSNVFDLLVKKSTYVLQSGTPGFEYKRSDIGKNVLFAGPILPHTKIRSEKRWYSEKLEAYEKVVLVTQGTVEKDSNKLLVPTLNAFKASRNVLVIATTGGSGTMELKEMFPYHNIIIEDFIPFADVMPYADVYITNGGYGGVMLAIQNKLPLVVAGVHEGKNEINARVGYFGLGVNLGTETPKPAAVFHAVMEVFSNDIYRGNIDKLSEEFSHYDANDILLSYIRELTVSNHNRKRQIPESVRLRKMLEADIY